MGMFSNIKSANDSRAQVIEEPEVLIFIFSSNNVGA